MSRKELEAALGARFDPRRDLAGQLAFDAGNPNHDPKSGQFASGGGSGHKGAGGSSKMQQQLDKWYKNNPDDAGEYDVEDIMSRFGASKAEATAMFNKIQHERYGKDAAGNPNHDPKSGQFASGGGSGHKRDKFRAERRDDEIEEPQPVHGTTQPNPRDEEEEREERELARRLRSRSPEEKKKEYTRFMQWANRK